MTLFFSHILSHYDRYDIINLSFFRYKTSGGFMVLNSLPVSALPDFPAELPAFTLDAEGRVNSWNFGCERATGIAASEILHTKDHWRAFYLSPRPLLADLLLSGRSAHPGRDCLAALMRHEQGSASCILRIDRKLEGESSVWTQAGLFYDACARICGAYQIFQVTSLAQFIANSPIVQTFIDKFPLPVSLVIRQKIVATNMAYAQLTGYDSPDEIIGMPVGLFIDESDRARFLRLNANNHEGLTSGEVYRWKYNVKGEIRHVEGRPTIFPWGEGTALISTIIDVTDTVRKEQELEGERARLERENVQLLAKISKQDEIFLGEGPAMRKTMNLALQMGKTDTNLVILGETGTGKSLLARVIHDVSARRAQPFVMVNCAAIPEPLLESEFFGYVKGAFTGAQNNRQGFLGAAHRGTLFLDEVAELNPSMQAKLLHAIENKKFMPVGGSRPLDGDVRLICATNRDLVQMVKDGTLREDFFYRIFVVDIPLPPLRERREDLFPLCDFFLGKTNAKYGTRKRFSPEARDLLRAYAWPGNVRELQSAVEQSVITAESNVILPENLPRHIAFNADGSAPACEDVRDLKAALQACERDIIRAAYRRHGTTVGVARALNISQPSAARKIARFVKG